MKKLLFALAIVSVVFSGAPSSNPETGPKVSIVFIEYFPVNQLKANVPFEVIFKLRNTGDGPINPFAEVTLSGSVYDEKGQQIFKMVDKKYNVYNFWPGDEGGRQRFYIGSLPAGVYRLKISVDAFNRNKGVNISNELFEQTLKVG